MPTKISDIATDDYRQTFPAFNVESKCIPLAEKIIKKYGEGQPPIPPNFDEIIKTIKKAIDKKETDAIKRENLRNVAYHIFSIEEGEALAKKILNIIDARKSSGLFSALFVSYVMSFDKANPLCNKIASILDKNKDNLSRTWKRRLEHINLLDVKNIEQEVAKKILMSDSIENAAIEINLAGGFLGSKLIANSIMVMADKVKKEVESGNNKSWEKLYSIVCEGDKIRADCGSAALLGLLAPYVKVNPENHRNTLQTLFLNSFGDPRMKNTLSFAPWPTLQERFGGATLQNECIALIKKWLIFGTIDMFFKIIAATAPDDKFGPRRELWEAYFQEDCISEACAIFGPDAKREVFGMAQNDDNLKDLIYSSFSGSVEHNKSALLMRVGDLTIVEWSHNGSFRIWFKGNKYKPEFYEDTYFANRLRGGGAGSDVEIRHHGSYWVNEIELEIRQRTGIRLGRD